MNLVLTNQGLKNEPEYLITSFYSDRSVYEVIRVMDGTALFLEDHFGRLLKSLKIIGLPFHITFAGFKQSIAELVRANQKSEGNIKFVYSVAGHDIHWAFTFIQHSYPSPEDYKSGVITDLLFAERLNPNAKAIQSGIRDEADQMIADRKLYEVLLVDRDGMITEGSRSNVFFVKSEVFYTAPASMILEGITRQKVIECLTKLAFPVVGQAVKADKINLFDAVFLTGTSPKVLPVRAIGSRMFDVQNKAVVRLIDSYNQMIQNYIRYETTGVKDS